MWLLAARGCHPALRFPPALYVQAREAKIRPTDSFTIPACDFCFIHSQARFCQDTYEAAAQDTAVLSVPPRACCLSVCLPVCLYDPAFELVALLFPGVAGVCSAKKQTFPGTFAEPPKGLVATGSGGTGCPSVSPPSNSRGFQGLLMCLSGQSSPTRLIKKNPGHQWLLMGPYPALNLQPGLQLNALVPPQCIFSPPSTSLPSHPQHQHYYIFSPNPFSSRHQTRCVLHHFISVMQMSVFQTLV